MNINPDDLKRTAVRLCFTGHGGNSFGTGVFVSNTSILTARHVVDPTGGSIKGLAVNPSAISVESAAFFGKRIIDRFHFATDPTVDIALAVLDAPKSVSNDYCCFVRADPISSFNIGDEVTVIGFAAFDGDLQIVTYRVIGVQGNAGAFICNGAVPEGYSGGPVFVNGGLAGIMYARNHGQGQSYFYGAQHLQLLSDNISGVIKWTDDIISPLRKYPLGPGIGGNEISMRLMAVIRACYTLFRGYPAREIVSEANASRFQCGPDPKLNGLIDLATITNPENDPVGFWHGVFIQAGQKSPRMLAALLLTLDDENLDDASRAEKCNTLKYLANIRP